MEHKAAYESRSKNEKNAHRAILNLGTQGFGCFKHANTNGLFVKEFFIAVLYPVNTYGTGIALVCKSSATMVPNDLID